MTRSSHPIREHILDFDDDFERELRRKRKNPEPSESSSNSEVEVEFEKEEPTTRVGEVEEVMAQDNRTIKELSASGLDNAAPLCIQYPAAAQGKTEEFELKSSLLHHIPKYHGLSMEDPNKHLKEFEVVCSSMTPINVDGSILKMKVVKGNKMQRPKVYGVCSMQGHPSEQCPQLIKNGGWENAHAIGFQDQNQPRNDPFSNTYNLRWRDHPNFKWREPQQGQQQSTLRQQPPGFYQRPFAPTQSQSQPAQNKSGSSIDNDQILQLLTFMAQSMQIKDKKVDELEKQVGQIAEFVGQFREQGKLPSSTVVNLKGGFESANAIMLRSGNEVGTDPQPSKSAQKEDEKLAFKEENQAKATARKEAPLPFLQAKNEVEEKDVLETFRKVHVNIPLLDAIQQIPKYAKFLKKLCTTRKRIREKDVVHMSENVFAMLQRKLPPKCKDPGSFTIPCVIGNTRFEHAMLDLGASINVMPYSIYASMNLGELKNDGVIIQLADCSNAYPKGVLEDVLVQVDHLIFPADFYVLDMKDPGHPSPSPLLLGRPFMKTAQTKIDVAKRAVTMAFGGDMINFKISEFVEKTNDVRFCGAIDVIENIGQECSTIIKRDVSRTTIEEGLGLKHKEHVLTSKSPNLADSIPCASVQCAATSLPHMGKPSSPISIPISNNRLLPCLVQVGEEASLHAVGFNKALKEYRPAARR
ncbi:unnamed protein product [Malus baccata var. baccata]